MKVIVRQSFLKISYLSRVNFYTQLIDFSHYLIRTQKHELKYSYCIYSLYLHFVYIVLLRTFFNNQFIKE